jgi:hypothetical protein
MRAEVRDTLLKTAALLAPDGAWGKHAYARTDCGGVSFPSSPNARCWCLVGALTRCAPDVATQIHAEQALERLLGIPAHSSLERWNDRFWRRKSDVLKALREAANG